MQPRVERRPFYPPLNISLAQPLKAVPVYGPIFINATGTGPALNRANQKAHPEKGTYEIHLPAEPP